MIVSEVHEAAALINKIKTLKDQVRRVGDAVENPFIVSGEVKYYVGEEEKRSVTKVNFIIEGDSAPSVMTIIKKRLEEDVDAAIVRLVELGVEAPE